MEKKGYECSAYKIMELWNWSQMENELILVKNVTENLRHKHSNSMCHQGWKRNMLSREEIRTQN